MSDKLRAAAEAALDALINGKNVRAGEGGTKHQPTMEDTAIEQLRAALAEQQDAEPVAWRLHPYDYGIGEKGFYVLTTRTEQVKAWGRKGWQAEPLYAQPPRREWQGLTDEEIAEVHRTCKYDASPWPLSRAIEAALKEKNHG